MEQAVQLTPLAHWGRIWFRYRSFSPLPWFLCLLIFPPNFVLPASSLVLVGMGIVFAECLRIWAVGYAGSVTRTRGDSVPRLIHSGPYRHVRNPLYIANIAIYCLSAVLFGFSYLAVLMFFYFSVQYTLIVAFEESTLVRLFGREYEDYRNKVPKWLPSLGASCESSGHPFLLMPALRSERSTLLVILGVMVLFVVKRSFF